LPVIGREVQTPAEFAAASLVANCRWLALATLGESGVPSTSYAPFAIVEASFAIAVSRLSAHTAELRSSPAASLLLTAEPAREADAYARTRLAVEVLSRFAVRGSPPSEAVWSALEDRHGATVRILRALPDFETVLLEPRRARLIAGFAAALDLDAATVRRILRGT
jgi:putative heme iron utilization protein